ncbi:tyrosine-type recombinase/integrase [Peribacillus asahii]|uniref:tyrosine-type recombinase/integrase n=1 Tax=Peribacillus asahii TaxID=228899 RepID=UPI00207A8BD5|nr:tyrosine-type recombinase/integrase [Peribacillus asahii]USK70184.1 tyrosine-type recombinase/integrase [Peribacillus asahii]
MKRSYIGERNTEKRPTATPIVSQRTIDQQPPNVRYTIEEALDIFIQAKEAEGVRPRTVGNYREHIKYLKRYIDRTPFYVDELTPSLIRDYLLFLMKERIAYAEIESRTKTGKGLSPHTVNMRLRTLKTMCTFWYTDGIIATNPTANIKRVKSDHVDEVPGLSDNEIERILNYFDERQFAQWRDKTLCLLLLDCGLRIQEAVSLTVDRVNLRTCEISIPADIAKNRKARELPVSREIAKRLIKLHEESRQYFGDYAEVFMNAYGEPFTAEAFRRRLNRMKKKLNMPRLHPHMFRHTFCRNYILNGGDIFTLQKIVDHADIKTTRKYIQMDDEHVRQQHNRFSPARHYLRKGK